MILINNTQLKINTGIGVEDGTAMSLTEQTAVDYTQKDDGKILLLFDNSSTGSETVTLLKGNALQGTGDMIITLPGEKETALVIESGKFVNAEGTDKGRLLMQAGPNVSLRVIELP